MAPAKYAIVVYAETKKPDIIKVSSIFKLEDKRRIPFDGVTINSKDKYAALTGELLHRVYIFQLGVTRDELDAVMKTSPGRLRQFKIPKRMSIGDLKFDVKQFLLAEESSKSKVSEVAVKKAKVTAKNDRDAKVVNEYGVKNKKGKSKTKVSAKKPLKNHNDSHSSTASDSSTGSVIDMDNYVKPIVSSTPKKNANARVKAGDNKNSFGGDTKGQKRVSSASGIAETETKKLKMEKQSDEVTEDIIEGDSNQPSCTIQSLEERIVKIETLLAEQSDIARDTNQKVNHLHQSLLSIPSQETGETLPKKSLSNKHRCALSSMKYAVNDKYSSDIDVPDDKIYVGQKRFISKGKLASLDTATKSLKARLEGLVKLMFDNPSEWNLTGKESKKKVTEESLKAMEAILNALNWKKFNLREIKIGKATFAPLTSEWVRRVVGKELSRLAEGKADDGKQQGLEEDEEKPEESNEDKPAEAHERKAEEEHEEKKDESGEEQLEDSVEEKVEQHGHIEFIGEDDLIGEDDASYIDLSTGNVLD